MMVWLFLLFCCAVVVLFCHFLVSLFWFADLLCCCVGALLIYYVVQLFLC